MLINVDTNEFLFNLNRLINTFFIIQGKIHGMVTYVKFHIIFCL